MEWIEQRLTLPMRFIRGPMGTQWGRSTPIPATPTRLLKRQIAKTPCEMGVFAVGPPGLEPGASSLSGMRSNQAELWAREGTDHTS